MPLRCVLRPNRSKPRIFNERDAARVMCIATNHGGTLAKILARYKSECQLRGRPRDRADEAFAVAEAALEQNQLLIVSDIELVQRITQIFGLVATLGRFLIRIPHPAVKAVSVGVIAVEKLIAGRLTKLQTQKAANDAALAIVRRAAANEASFLRRAGASGAF